MTKHLTSNLERKKVIVIYGYSGCGKSTLIESISELKKDIFIIDNDAFREKTNNRDFTREGRIENIKNLSKYIDDIDEKYILAGFILPYKEMRESLRIIDRFNLKLVYCECDINVCIERDPKGLYKKALSGEIKNFTGISDTFDDPNPWEYNLKLDMTDDVILNANKIIKEFY